MGAWGMGTFDDDIAVDWLEDLGDSDPVAFFRECLDLTSQGSLEYVACVGVVCTAEMIHAILLGPREGLPEPAQRWLREGRFIGEGLVVENNRSIDELSQSGGTSVARFEGFVPDAIAGLKSVLADESEMYQLWKDDGECLPQWIARITDLVDRLSEWPARRE